MTIGSPAQAFSSRRVALLLGTLVAALGLAVLLGWVFDVAGLKGVFPGSVTMKANTAAGLLLCGLNLVLVSSFPNPRCKYFLGCALSLLVVTVAGLTLSEYFFGWNLGIDQRLFHDVAASVGTTKPGRMSPTTALSFIFVAIGLSVRSLPVPFRWQRPTVGALGAATIIAATMTLAGYFLQSVVDYHLWNYNGTAVHTAAGFLLLGFGLLALTPRKQGFTWSLNAITTGGFAIGIVGVLAAAGGSNYLIYRLQESVALVGRTQEDLKVLQQIDAGMASLESGQRLFIITLDEQALRQRSETKVTVQSYLSDFGKLTVNDPSQRRRAAELDQMIAQRNSWGDQTITALRNQGFQVAERMISSDEGTALTGSIHALLAEMSAEEYRLLAERQEKSSAASTSAFLALPLSVFLAVAVLVLALFFLDAGVGEQIRAEEELVNVRERRRSDQNFRALLESAPDAMVIVDTRGKIVLVNSQTEKLFGFSKSELLGQAVEAIIPHRYHGRHTQHRDSFFGDPKVRAMGLGLELFALRKDQTEFPVEISLSPIETSEGTLVSSAIRDITERKRIEQGIQRLNEDLERRGMALEALNQQLAGFQKLVEGVRDYAIIMLDAKGGIASWNSGAQLIKGYTAEEIIGQHFSRFYPPEDIANGKPDRELREVARLDRIEDEGWRLRKDGSRFLANVVISALRDTNGNLWGFAKVTRDITEQRKTEEGIRQLNQELKKRGSELEISNKELESFTYSVSHDLRAPLRHIDGFSKILVEDHSAELSEEGREYLDLIRVSTREMGQLVDDLLDLARVGRKDPVLQLTGLDSLANEIISALKRDNAGRSIEWKVGRLPFVECDPGLIKQVFTNLLSNAVKYTSPRKPAVIEVGTSTQDGKPVVFVRDNGVGFNMKHADKLFGVFQRLHRAEDFEGTGVGLATVRRIVHKHHGRIWADAKVDQGATFYFTLGTSESPEAESPEPGPEKQPIEVRHE